MPALALIYNLSTIARPAIRKVLREGTAGLTNEELNPAITSTSAWVIWLAILLIIRLRTGGTHPPVDDGILGPKRRLVAIATLVLFVLLFMPSPFVQY